MSPLSPASVQALARLRTYATPPTSYFDLPLSRRAAVLILLFADRAGQLRVVLSIRAKTLKTYPGQVAFPGGKAESLSESPFETARREADEEIGLPRDNKRIPHPFRIEHICQLPMHLARTELGVRPCVAFLHANDEPGKQSLNVEENLIPRLDAREVAAVFSAPFHNFLRTKDELRDKNDFIYTSGTTGSSEWYDGIWTDWFDGRFRMHNFHVPITGQSVSKPITKLNGEAKGADRIHKVEESAAEKRVRVFGMTARILVDTARIAYAEEPEFEHPKHSGDEDMISRFLKIGRLGDLKKPTDQVTMEDVTNAAKI